MSRFEERSEIEEGFAAVYEERLAPRIKQLEKQRKRLVLKSKLAIPQGIGIGAVVGVAVLYFNGNPVPSVILGALAAFISAMFLMDRSTFEWRGTIYEAVMPVICDFIGDCTYRRKATTTHIASRMRDLRVLVDYDEAILADEIDGTYEGTDYVLLQASLQEVTHISNGDGKSRTRRKTIFHGLLFRIKVPVRIPTQIVIMRNWGSVGNRLAGLFSGGSGRGMPKVEIDHPRFDAMFEVHAEDPEAAKRFLPPIFLDNLIAIAEAEGGRSGAEGLRAAFADGVFYMALDRRRGFLDLGGVNESVLDLHQQLHSVFHDMALIRRVIDRLHGV